MSGVGATVLDGKATRDEIFVDLKARVAKLAQAGITPGLGTILVGDDPGSQAYVRGKHSDCAKVGITSLRRLAGHFRHVAWLNPEPPRIWPRTTIEVVAAVFPMFPLTLDGLGAAVRHLVHAS